MALRDGLPRWLGGRKATNNDNPIAELETRLNQPIGEILESYGIVSKNIKDHVGDIQAATLAIVRHYDSLDDEAKAELRELNFNGNIPLFKPKRSGDGVEFNDAIIFDIAAQVSDKATSAEEKALLITQEMHDALADLGISQEKREEAEKIVASRQGTNPDPALSSATPITPIYKAIDKTFGQSGNILSAIHIALRSGVTRIPTGLQNVATAELAYKTNFANGPFERDPDYIKEMITAGTAINAYERDNRNTPAPTQQDVALIMQGIGIAKKELSELAEKQTIGADFSALLKDIADYEAEVTLLQEKEWQNFWTQQLQKQAEARPKPGIIVGDPNKATDDGEAEDGQGSEDDDAAFKRLLDEEMAKRDLPPSNALDDEYYKQFYTALTTAIGQDNAAEKNIELMKQRGEFKWLADTLVKHQLDDQNQVVFTGLQGHNFIVTPNKIEHVDNNDDFSPEEALQYALIAISNENMCSKGITITGTPQEQAMILAAIKAMNAENAFAKIFNKEEIPVDPALDQHMQALVAHAQSGKTTKPESVVTLEPTADIVSTKPNDDAIQAVEAIKQPEMMEARTPNALDQIPAPILPENEVVKTATPSIPPTDNVGITDAIFTAVAEKVVSAEGGMVTKNEIKDFLKAANFSGSLQKGYEAVRDRLEADKVIQFKPGSGWQVLKTEFSCAATSCAPLKEEIGQTQVAEAGEEPSSMEIRPRTGSKPEAGTSPA